MKNDKADQGAAILATEVENYLRAQVKPIRVRIQGMIVDESQTIIVRMDLGGLHVLDALDKIEDYVDSLEDLDVAYPYYLTIVS